MKRGLIAIFIVAIFFGMAIIPTQAIIVKTNDIKQEECTSNGYYCIRVTVKDKAGRYAEGVQVLYYKGGSLVQSQLVDKKYTDSFGQATSDWAYDEYDWAKIKFKVSGLVVHEWPNINIYVETRDDPPDGIIRLKTIQINPKALSKTLIMEKFQIFEKLPIFLLLSKIILS